MRANSILTHLRPYSILRKRGTTIAHAFASAIAPAEVLVGNRLADALKVLGQSPDADLTCVYCDRPAETWDHLVALVHAREMSGYGHTLGNLVPACKECNSRRGNKEWQSWLRIARRDHEQRIGRIERYVEFCGKAVRSIEDLQRLAPEQMAKYADIRRQVLELLKEADNLAGAIRSLASAKMPGERREGPGASAT
jgi:HNH endonuclease